MSGSAGGPRRAIASVYPTSSPVVASQLLGGNRRAAPASERGTGRTAYTKDVRRTEHHSPRWHGDRNHARKRALAICTTPRPTFVILRELRRVLLRTCRRTFCIALCMGEIVVVPTSSGFAEADRAEVHTRGHLHFCVHILCLSGDHVYLQRRKRTRSRNPDRWTSTVSGHITASDAKFNQPLMINPHAALIALDHEIREELGYSLPVHRDARYLGDVDVVSRGPAETCNCRTLVFAMEVQELPPARTEEVEEIAAFTRDEIRQALDQNGSLAGADGRRYQFADNFAGVFGRFLSPERGREIAAPASQPTET
jgi:isopentenyldiphosphate isomerase